MGHLTSSQGKRDRFLQGSKCVASIRCNDPHELSIVLTGALVVGLSTCFEWPKSLLEYNRSGESWRTTRAPMKRGSSEAHNLECTVWQVADEGSSHGARVRVDGGPDGLGFRI